jgi:hypothetical protein
MVNVFSYCLYGPENPRYYPPMLTNVQLIQTHFPSWKVYIYIAPDVPQSMVDKLAAYPNVVLKPTGILGAKNMIERFFAIDEPDVDVMMVRDADSYVHHRDRWAIREFLASSYQAHTIRDHPDHTGWLMGGLWGIRKSAGLRIRDLYASYEEDTSLGHRVAHDQNFLMDAVYPKVRNVLLVHYSKGRVFNGETAVTIPFKWSPDFFCGRIEQNYQDPPQQIDPQKPLSFLHFRRM